MRYNNMKNAKMQICKHAKFSQCCSAAFLIIDSNAKLS